MSGYLPDSPARVVRDLLIQLGLGTAASTWPVYVSSEPSSPDNCITVYDTSGLDHGREHIGGERQEHNGFQIRIRSATPDVGWTRTSLIATTLDTSTNLTTVVIGTHTYLVQSITRKNGPLAIGKEAITNRNLFTINAVISVRHTS